MRVKAFPATAPSPREWKARAVQAQIPRPFEMRRRSRPSENVVLHTPVLGYGRDVDDSLFLDEAPILSLNAHGRVMALAANVRRSKTILLVNDGA